ncbi:NADH:flavin oxidoreductase [Paenibacillus riograndensis]|uniref:NADH:flavin oxidoreductase n=1 Tax=Paenibacillus riograndensis SBR5 TaxID=1073571 RepID=A0A0E4CXF4_9BACL|nr:NADH:flavin oxidoreductase [Paenibacillus riograndensis]CQR56324.1 NADH:flavin oxidoreductase [Paenibacillus riograndensis SBR5]
MNTDKLFAPFRAGSLTLANRIVMAPMTRVFSPDGVPGEDVAAYYRRRAEGGVGLIVTEGTAINHPSAVSHQNIPNIHGEASLKGWAKVVEEVHAAGGKIVPQLWHVGMARTIGELPNADALPVGPSGLNLAGEQITEPMTKEEISGIVAAFAQAAADAKAVGFDGIELHGAHGYLIDQFFWEKTNKRTDEYGGDLEARTTFAVEIIDACRRAVGPDFPIILRFSQWKAGDYAAKLAQTPEELARFLTPLSNAGVDIFHCSTRRFWLPEFEGSELNLAGWTKKITGKPTITVGSVGLSSEFGSAVTEQNEEDNLDRLMEKLEKAEFDLVAVGRALISDPAWPAKVQSGRKDEIIAFTPEATRTLY